MRRQTTSALGLGLSMVLLLSCKTTSGGGSKVSAAGNASCSDYPRPYKAEPAAREKAEKSLIALANLHKFSPMMDWSETKGTLKSLNDISIPICSTSEDLNDSLEKLFTDNRDLFQIDTNDWTLPTDVSCKSLAKGTTRIHTLHRKAMGQYAQPYSRDTISLIIDTESPGKSSISRVFGSYLPFLNANLKNLFAGCNDGAYQKSLTTELQKTVFPIAIFDQCIYKGNSQYQAQTTDTVQFEGVTTWDYTVEKEEILFYKSGTGRIVIIEKNYTKDIKSSDVFCDKNAGFEFIFDAINGHLTAVKNGIGCTVCLK